MQWKPLPLEKVDECFEYEKPPEEVPALETNIYFNETMKEAFEELVNEAGSEKFDETEQARNEAEEQIQDAINKTRGNTGPRIP